VKELKNAGKLLVAHKKAFDKFVKKTLEGEGRECDITVEFNNNGEAVYTIFDKSEEYAQMQIRNGKIATDCTSFDEVVVDIILVAVRDGSYMMG
jgi:TATA-binding protein-associated factor Taf7